MFCLSASALSLFLYERHFRQFPVTRNVGVELSLGLNQPVKTVYSIHRGFLI